VNWIELSVYGLHDKRLGAIKNKGMKIGAILLSFYCVSPP
jgi:hypothetical protein